MEHSQGQLLVKAYLPSPTATKIESGKEFSIGTFVDLEWSATPGAYYTLILYNKTDPNNIKVMWMATNIPENRVREGYINIMNRDAFIMPKYPLLIRFLEIGSFAVEIWQQKMLINEISQNGDNFPLDSYKNNKDFFIPLYKHEFNIL